MNDHEDLQTQLAQALAELQYLREENTRLRELAESPLGQTTTDDPTHIRSSLTAHSASTIYTENNLSPEAKVELFRSLFRGRDDVYAIRWESRTGKSGYSPACPREWETSIDNKTKLKAPSRIGDYFPLTNEVIRNHLLGRCTIGIYPLLPDESCWFLAADFDKKTWQADARAFLDTCSAFEIPAQLERSRSGNGGHVWIFFEEPIPAGLARRLGSYLLTQTMERRHQLGLDSYDRLFPSQDTMPKGGFGNLIALPLQKEPRASGKSVFLDTELNPYPDQWQFLAGVTKAPRELVESIVQKAGQQGDIIGVRLSLTDETAEQDPWTLLPSKKRPDAPITDPLPARVRVVRGNLLYIEKAGLPEAMLNRLTRLAAFQNPEFYKAQAMRLSTFGKPRIISCAEEFPKHLALPRGSLDDVRTLLTSHNVALDLIDERYAGTPINASFSGTLRPMQVMAASAMLPFDDGVLCAPTAFGKTVLAAWIIAERRTNTLILVHRQQLLDQWRQRLSLFLNLSLTEIGQIGGAKNTQTGAIDVAMLQSLQRKGEVKNLVADYGQIIVDECHHVSAFTFEQVLKQVKAKYILGLTATPIRKDGHHPIILMQCGPIRYRLAEKKLAETRLLHHAVVPRSTDFSLPTEATEHSIQDIYHELAQNQARNELIVSDLLKELEAGRSPLLLTERTEHLELLTARLAGSAKHVIQLKGGLGKKQRQAIMDELSAIPDHESRVILATGRYIGEGFDDARLDTLFLAMPISWRGTLQQYVGRLHRAHDNKQEVRVYDYVDTRVPMLARMYEKRVKGYKAIGYVMEPDKNSRIVDCVMTR